MCHGRASPCARGGSVRMRRLGKATNATLPLRAQAHAITTRSRTRDVGIEECANAPWPCRRWERKHGRSAVAAFRVTHDALNTPKITVQETKRIWPDTASLH
jgi:hypothetical protein